LLTDGKVAVNNPNFEVRYAYYGDYIVYSLYNTLYDKEVAKVLIKVEGNYVVEENSRE